MDTFKYTLDIFKKMSVRLRLAKSVKEDKETKEEPIELKDTKQESNKIPR